MKRINVIINNEKYDFEEGMTLSEISQKINKSNYPDLVAVVNNELVPLETKITSNCDIMLINALHPIGNKIYQKGLLFVLCYAVKELFGYGYHVKACHSIDKSIKMRTNLPLTHERMLKIKEKMQEIVKNDMPMTQCVVSRKNAIEYFKSINQKTKAATFEYTINKYVPLNKLGDLYDQFFSPLPASTKVLTDFDLYLLDKNNFMLQFPVALTDGKIPEYIDRKKIVKAFNDNYLLCKKLGIHNSGDINKAVANGTISDIIKLTEIVSSNELLNLAKEIHSKRRDVRLVLIAGPSSSGKTTTSKKLSMFLKTFGLNPKALSIDDYFLNREDTPKNEKGELDFESIRAINIDLFNDHLTRLLNGEKVSIPTFNFYKGKSEYLGKEIELQKNDILIIEGLHAINEELTQKIDKNNKYKVYVSPFTDLNIDDHNMIPNTNIRLLRRIVRDNRTRGYDAEATIRSWEKVRAGESKFIFPHQGEVDYVYNTSLLYEIGALKLFAEPLLFGVDDSSLYYQEAVKLLSFLDMFVGIPTDEIPSESILREFIGGSYFE